MKSSMNQFVQWTSLTIYSVVRILKVMGLCTNNNYKMVSNFWYNGYRADNNLSLTIVLSSPFCIIACFRQRKRIFFWNLIHIIKTFARAPDFLKKTSDDVEYHWVALYINFPFSFLPMLCHLYFCQILSIVRDCCQR